MISHNLLYIPYKDEREKEKDIKKKNYSMHQKGKNT